MSALRAAAARQLATRGNRAVVDVRSTKARRCARLPRPPRRRTGHATSDVNAGSSRLRRGSLRAPCPKRRSSNQRATRTRARDANAGDVGCRPPVSRRTCTVVHRATSRGSPREREGDSRGQAGTARKPRRDANVRRHDLCSRMHGEARRHLPLRRTSRGSTRRTRDVPNHPTSMEAGDGTVQLPRSLPFPPHSPRGSP